MKRNIILGCLAMVLSCTSCDNYLDLVPKGKSVLNQTSDYVGLIEDVYGYPFDSEWYLCGEASSYNMTLIENYNSPLLSTSFFWNEEDERAPYLTDTGSSDMYATCYRKIAKYNIVIQHISSSVGSEEDKKAGMAQAKILRAYNYFILINTFAKPYNPTTASQDRGIILRTEFNLEEVGEQRTVAEVYAAIEKDISEALPNLPHVALNSFRPDRSFGCGLKAKVHLYKREIDEALQAGLDAIKEAEGEGQHKLWNMNIEYNAGFNFYKTMFPTLPEFMLEYNGAMYSMFRTTVQNMYFKYEYNNPENLLYQHGINSMSPSPLMVRKPVANLFKPSEDLRYTFNMGTMPPRNTAEQGAISLNNMMNRWNCAGMKLSDVYLMVAECYARKGSGSDAMKYVNDLRKNRLIAKYYKDLVAKSAEEAIMMVREERKRELLGTSNGFFDMRRFCAEFNETLTREYKGETYTLKPTSHLLIYPFPVAAIQNSNLIQNSK